MKNDGELRNTIYRKNTSSGRRMTAARRLLYRIAVPVGLAIIKGWLRTCRVLEQRGRGLKVGWLISPSVDGELGAMMVRRLGATAIRGSSTHTGARALRDYYEALVKDGISPIITPDGPRGPRFKFKIGAILLGQMSGRPILPMAYAVSRAWLVKWDKFVIPVPFSRVAIAIGPPRYVPRISDASGIEALQGEMEQELKRLYGVARGALRKR